MEATSVLDRSKLHHFEVGFLGVVLLFLVVFEDVVPFRVRGNRIHSLLFHSASMQTSLMMQVKLEDDVDAVGIENELFRQVELETAMWALLLWRCSLLWHVDWTAPRTKMLVSFVLVTVQAPDVDRGVVLVVLFDPVMIPLNPKKTERKLQGRRSKTVMKLLTMAVATRQPQ